MPLKRCKFCTNTFDPEPMMRRLEELKARGVIQNVWPPVRCRDCSLKKKQEEAED